MTPARLTLDPTGLAVEPPAVTDAALDALLLLRTGRVAPCPPFDPERLLRSVLSVPAACVSPTPAAAVTRWRRMRAAKPAEPYKGELLAVLEQDGGGFCVELLTTDLYVAHVEGRLPRGRMTIRRA